MAKINYCFVMCALLTVSAFANENFPPQPHSSSSAPPTQPPNPTTHSAPTSPSTKPTPPTTVSTTTATTTTTTSTPSTSSSTITTPKPTPTPTPKPSTTSTPKPTPTPTPKPAPTPVPGTWHVNYTSSNKSCILLKMAAIIDFPYYTINNKTEEGQLIIWDNADVSGVCEEDPQKINLNWASVYNGTEKNQSISFSFKKNGTKFDLAEIFIRITLDKTTFPDAKELNKVLVHVKDDFVTPLQNSYKCDKTQALNLTESRNSNVTQGTIKIKDLQFQAFLNVTNARFAEAIDCEPYETPDIVPIAVGCALAALIVIVLITYLIGRRRNQARGYLSMFTENKREADYIPMKNLSCFQ